MLIYFILLINFFAYLTAYFDPNIELNEQFENLAVDDKWGSHYVWESLSYLISFALIATHLSWYTKLKAKKSLILFGIVFPIIMFIAGVIEIIMWYYNKGEIGRGIAFVVTSFLLTLLLFQSHKIDLSEWTKLSNVSRWHLFWLWLPIGLFITPFIVYLSSTIGLALEDLIQFLTFDFSFEEIFKDILLGIVLAIIYNIIKYSFEYGFNYIQISESNIKIKVRNLFFSWLIFGVGFGLLFLTIWLFKISIANYVFT